MNDKIYKLIGSAGALSGGTKVVIVDEDMGGWVEVRTLVKNTKGETLFAETRLSNLRETGDSDEERT